MLSFTNNTGKALTLFDGAQTLVVLSNGQQAQNIPVTVTSVKLGGAKVAYRRLNGAFVDGNAYVATMLNQNVAFNADGQPRVTFG